VYTARLDWRLCCTPLSSTSILSYISSCLASCFCKISCEASTTATMIKLKSSTVSIVYILVKVSLDFFRVVRFMGETFLFFRGSASSVGSLGGVTSPCFYWSSLLFVSSTSSSPPHPGDIKAVPSDALLKFWNSSVFFLLLVLGRSFAS
jgi:hypothetical protein